MIELLVIVLLVFRSNLTVLLLTLSIDWITHFGKSASSILYSSISKSNVSDYGGDSGT